MPKLFLVPTPIGNLEDITLRAIRILKEVDVILAEDTRKTGNLLKHYQINNTLRSHHQHNEHKSIENIIQQLLDGIVMALVTDAGTPAISDPGFLLVRECLNANIEVECLPGATALIPALVHSGLPSDRFIFEGFLPLKKGRKAKLLLLANQVHTMIFYESPHRLLKTLEQFKTTFGVNRHISVSRELTKLHEENVRGTIEKVLEHFKEKNIKGEIVIIVDGLKKIKN